MSAEDQVEGFIIMHPDHPASAGYHTFGRTMGEAWERFSPRRDRDAGEMAALRGRAAAQGIRPIPATLIIKREGEA